MHNPQIDIVVKWVKRKYPNDIVCANDCQVFSIRDKQIIEWNIDRKTEKVCIINVADEYEI